jgi:cell fate regulator YaaT (PSP1 superfamily)
MHTYMDNRIELIEIKRRKERKGYTYMYICIHMYFCLYTYIFIYMFAYIYTYIHTYMDNRIELIEIRRKKERKGYGRGKIKKKK